MTFRSSRRLTGALLAALVVLAAGCGDDDSGGSSGGSGWQSALTTTTTEAETTTTSTTEAETTTTTSGSGGLFDDSGTGAPGSGLFGTGEHDFDSDAPPPEAPEEGDAEVVAFYGTELVDIELGWLLFDACASGDMAACDTMYIDAAPGSDAEQFGATCAGELPEADRYCVELPSASTHSYVPAGGPYTGSVASDLEEALVNACGRGSMNACDALFDYALGEASQLYGAPCGDRIQTNLYCSVEWGLGYDWAVAWRDAVGI